MVDELNLLDSPAIKTKTDVQTTTSRKAFWCGAILGAGIGLAYMLSGIIHQDGEAIWHGFPLGLGLAMGLGLLMGAWAMAIEAIVNSVLLWFNPKRHALLQKIDEEKEAEDAADDPRFAHVDLEATELDYSHVDEQIPAPEQQVPAPETSSGQVRKRKVDDP